MIPSRLILFSLCFFAAYSQALSLEFGTLRISIPYILSIVGISVVLVERALLTPHRESGFRLYVPALVFVTVYLIVGSLALIRVQADPVPNSPDAEIRVIEQMGRLVFSLCTMLFVANAVRTTQIMARALMILSASAGMVGAYGIYQVLATAGGFYVPLLPNTGSYGLAPGMVGASRAIGTMQEPSFLAGFMCFSIASTLLLIIAREHSARWWSAVLWMSMGVQAVCLLMTTSTGGFVGLVVILGAGWLILRGSERRRLVIICLMGAILLAIPVTYVISQPGFQQKLIIGTIGKLGHASAMERSEFCRAGLEMFADHPAIGVGPGLYDSFCRSYTSAFSLSKTLIVNNVYIELLAETGLVGFTAFMIMFVCLTARAVRRWRYHNKDSLLYAVPVIALAALVVQLMAYPTFKMEFIWLLFGLVAAPCPSSTRPDEKGHRGLG